MHRRSLWLFAVGLWSLGCSSDDDSNGGPVGKCKDFAHTWCDHAISCSVQVGRLPATEQAKQTDDCERVAIAAVNCDKAIAVSGQYDTCMSGVAAMPCSSWDVEASQLGSVSPPSSCTGVITISN